MANAGQVVRSYDYGTPTAPIGTSSNGTVTSAATETIDAVLGPITFVAMPGVRYKVTFSGRAGSLTVATDRFLMGFRYTTDGSTPTNTSSALGGGWRYGLSQAATIGPGMTAVATFMPVPVGGVPTTVKVSTSWSRTVGTGTLTPVGQCELIVEAIGTN